MPPRSTGSGIRSRGVVRSVRDSVPGELLETGGERPPAEPTEGAQNREQFETVAVCVAHRQPRWHGEMEPLGVNRTGFTPDAQRSDGKTDHHRARPGDPRTAITTPRIVCRKRGRGIPGSPFLAGLLVRINPGSIFGNCCACMEILIQKLDSCQTSQATAMAPRELPRCTRLRAGEIAPDQGQPSGR
jgi:hypothetical protein